MRCPVCNFDDTKVVDSRVQSSGVSIRRRRECEKCVFRFSTIEEVELLDMVVIKRDGSRETYDRSKIAGGLRKALEKRPVTENDFRNLLNLIECDIQRVRQREIKSSEIGEIIMERLKRFDKVAYIRFASVYRQFEDVETFQKELRILNHRQRKTSVRKKSRRRH